MTDIRFPQWRDEQLENNYPFADRATLTNSVDQIDPAMFLDAIFYPVGGESGLYLAKITVEAGLIRLSFSDSAHPEVAVGEFDPISPSETIELVDASGRPAGALICDPIRLTGLQAMGLGDHLFNAQQTPLVADVCTPTPAIGVRGFLLEDGTIITGDVWLVAGAGVLFEHQQQTRQSLLLEAGTVLKEVITVNVVGDPLFKRRLCESAALFTTPKFIRTVTFRDGSANELVVSPDEFGDIQITVSDALAADTVLRVITTENGINFLAIGDPLI